MIINLFFFEHFQSGNLQNKLSEIFTKMAVASPTSEGSNPLNNNNSTTNLAPGAIAKHNHNHIVSNKVQFPQIFQL